MEFVRFLKMKENKYVCVINKITYHISYYGINPDDATEKEHFVCVLLFVFLWPSQALDGIMYHKI